MTKKAYTGLLLIACLLILGSSLVELGDIVSHTIIRESYSVHRLKPIPNTHMNTSKH